MGRSGPHLSRWGRTDPQVRTSIRGKINIFHGPWKGAEKAPGSGDLHVNSMSTEPLSARLKKETPAQLVVVQGFSWSGR